MGWNHHMLKVIETTSEMQARKIMWEQYMSEDQKNNCEDIEVFLSQSSP
jgi:hypothetical protein